MLGATGLSLLLWVLVFRPWRPEQILREPYAVESLLLFGFAAIITFAALLVYLSEGLYPSPPTKFIVVVGVFGGILYDFVEISSPPICLWLVLMALSLVLYHVVGFPPNLLA